MTTDVAYSSINSIFPNKSKNGSVVIHCSIRSGIYQTNNDAAKPGPTDVSLEAKYTDRFDDLDYYELGGATVIGG
jgi:hypothetical protein